MHAHEEVKTFFTPEPRVSFQNDLILNSDLIVTELRREQWGYLSAEKSVVKYTCMSQIQMILLVQPLTAPTKSTTSFDAMKVVYTIYSPVRSTLNIV